MIVIVDIDNVLNNLTEKTIELYNALSDKNIQMSDIKTYNFDECLPQKDADAIVELFKKQELWDSLSPLSDSQWGLKTLINTGHEIYLATATHPENFAWKVEWIKKYYPFIDTNNIVCITNKSLLKCEVMIDDCLDNLIGNMCDRICFDYPWNQDASKDFAYNIIRAYNWKDIINAINDIIKKEYYGGE